MEDNGKLQTYDEYINEDYYCRSWISTLKASLFIFFIMTVLGLSVREFKCTYQSKRQFTKN